jgi:hypothetical protein
MASSTSERRADRSSRVNAPPAPKRQLDKLWKYLIVTGILLTAVILALGGYMELVKAGKVPQPSAEGLGNFAQSGILVTFWAALSVIVVCAAIAPVLFAVRSGDGLTIIVSIVLVVVTWSLVYFSRTVIDLAVASIIYLASMVLSVTVFGVTRIIAALRGERVNWDGSQRWPDL